MSLRDDILAQFKRANPGATVAQAEAIVPVRVQDLDDYKLGEEVLTFSPADGASVRVQKLGILHQLISDTVGPRGPTGDAGLDGSTIIVGQSLPSRDFGNPGDIYINELSWNLFEKDYSNRWRFIGNIKGDPGMGIQPQGEATVAEVNAISNPDAGDVWIMLDAGTITNGSGGQPMDVIIDDWVGYGDSDDNWMNLGQLTGEKGDTGPQGDTANVTAGTTTTLAAGTDATVDSVVAGNDVTLNFGIPEGVQGVKGDTGDTGSIGVAATVDVDPIVIKVAAGGTPTVTNTGTTAAALFQFGIVTGDQGIIGPDGPQGVPGAGIYPQGEATVAEINALVADPGAGELWIMLDAGTITYGSQPVDVAIDDWLGWGAEGYFVNMGQMQGMPGEDGTDGTDGTDAIAPVVSIGTVTGVPSGTAPTVTDADPGVDVLLNFTLEKGETGDAGLDGSDGVDGITPLAPTVSIGTVGGVPAGTDPTVTDGDSGPDVVLNFLLEQGETGSIGPAGQDGPTSVSADAGNQATLGTDTLMYVGGLLPTAGGTMTGQVDMLNNIAIRGQKIDLSYEDLIKINANDVVVVGDTGATVFFLAPSVLFDGCIPRAGVAQGSDPAELTRKDYVDDANTTQDEAIALNTAKATGSDRVLVSEGLTSVAESGGIGTDRMTSIVSCTQAEYDAIALVPPVDFATTMYVIAG